MSGPVLAGTMVSAVNKTYPAPIVMTPQIKGRKSTHNQNHNLEWSDLMNRVQEAVRGLEEVSAPT